MKNNFLKNVINLMSGTLFSQIILISTTPILTRLYSAEDFGQLSIFVSIISILSVSASLRYNRAIPLPKKLSDANNLLYLSTIIILIFSLLLLFLVFIINISNRLPDTLFEINSYLYFIPVGVAFIGLIDIYGYWLMRVESYRTVAIAKIIQTLCIVSFQIFFYNFGVTALILGHILGLLIGFIIVFYISFDSAIKKITEIKIELLKKVAFRYRDFPKYSTWEALASSAGNNAPVLLFGLYYGASSAAFFALTYKVLSMPMNMIGTSISKVYFIKAAKIVEKDELKVFSKKIFECLCYISFPLAFWSFFVLPKIFSLAFGSEWSIAGEYARIMVPWLVMTFVCSPLSPIIAISEKQEFGLVFQVIFLFVKITSILLCSFYFSEKTTLIVLTLSSVVCLLIFLVKILSFLHVEVLYTIKKIMHSILIAMFCNLPLIFISVSNYEFNSINFFVALFSSLILTATRVYFVIRKLKKEVV